MAIDFVPSTPDSARDLNGFGLAARAASRHTGRVRAGPASSTPVGAPVFGQNPFASLSAEGLPPGPATPPGGVAPAKAKRMRGRGGPLGGAAGGFCAIASGGMHIASGGGDSGGGGDDAGTDPVDARTDVGVFGTIDQFDRPDSATSMGDFAPRRPWSPDAGTWGIDSGEAYLVESSEFRNHSLVGLGQGDGGAQVRLDKVVNGAGLVFRYVGPYNYWAVVAVPDVATWNIIKVVDGDQEVIGNTGQSPTADGTTVGVRLRGETIDVIVNGRIRKSIVDDFQVNAGKVGITARCPDSGDARFDDFVAGLPGGVPLTGGGGDGGNRSGGSSTTTPAP